MSNRPPIVLEGTPLEIIIQELLNSRPVDATRPFAPALHIVVETHAEGVELPDNIKERFPHYLTLVLEELYWDLSIEGDRFTVVLRFGGEFFNVVVPYSAVIRVHDARSGAVIGRDVDLSLLNNNPEPEPEETPTDNVVNLADWRKKR
jgi:hypothetical protein